MSGANSAGVYVGPYHFAHTESLSPAGTVKFDNYTGGAFLADISNAGQQGRVHRCHVGSG